MASDISLSFITDNVSGNIILLSPIPSCLLSLNAKDDLLFAIFNSSFLSFISHINSPVSLSLDTLSYIHNFFSSFLSILLAYSTIFLTKKRLFD